VVSLTKIKDDPTVIEEGASSMKKIWLILFCTILAPGCQLVRPNSGNSPLQSDLMVVQSLDSKEQLASLSDYLSDDYAKLSYCVVFSDVKPVTYFFDSKLYSSDLEFLQRHHQDFAFLSESAFFRLQFDPSLHEVSCGRLFHQAALVEINLTREAPKQTEETIWFDLKEIYPPGSDQELILQVWRILRERIKLGPLTFLFHDEAPYEQKWRGLLANNLPSQTNKELSELVERHTLPDENLAASTDEPPAFVGNLITDSALSLRDDLEQADQHAYGAELLRDASLLQAATRNKALLLPYSFYWQYMQAPLTTAECQQTQKICREKYGNQCQAAMGLCVTVVRRNNPATVAQLIGQMFSASEQKRLQENPERQQVAAAFIQNLIQNMTPPPTVLRRLQSLLERHFASNSLLLVSGYHQFPEVSLLPGTRCQNTQDSETISPCLNRTTQRHWQFMRQYERTLPRFAKSLKNLETNPNITGTLNQLFASLWRYEEKWFMKPEAGDLTKSLISVLVQHVTATPKANGVATVSRAVGQEGLRIRLASQVGLLPISGLPEREIQPERQTIYYANQATELKRVLSQKSNQVLDRTYVLQDEQLASLLAQLERIYQQSKDHFQLSERIAVWWQIDAADQILVNEVSLLQ